MSTWSNILAVARREFLVRARTRSFVLGTLLLVVGVVVIALLPVIVEKLSGTSTTNVAIVAPDRATAERASTTTTGLLNASLGTTPSETPAYVVHVLDDLDPARDGANDGTYAAALEIQRTSDGALDFVLYTNEPATGRTAGLLQQAANAIAVSDRLDRLGIAPTDQATLFSPAQFSVQWPDPARTDPIGETVAGEISQAFLGFGMTLLVFMIIVMYGTWISMSVVEEKTSRVMEVVLNAATPFQLLGGKVLGVGAVALVQYGAVVVAGLAAIVAQGAVAELVLGESAATVELPEGITAGLLVAFGAYGVLGFLLYAALYAAAGSLVSRQEDVNAAVMPLTFLTTGGYLVGVYAATGVLDPQATWVVGLSQVPFLSPFMMLGRITAGGVEPWEIALSVVLLSVAILAALWFAARVYAVGVLLYGQRPGVRKAWRLLREGM